MIVATVVLATPTVAIVKVPVVEPPGTVTVAGTVALVVFDESATEMPPDGAAPFRVTVPVEGLPPATLVGFATRLRSVGGVISRLL